MVSILAMVIFLAYMPIVKLIMEKLFIFLDSYVYILLVQKTLMVNHIQYQKIPYQKKNGKH